MCLAFYSLLCYITEKKRTQYYISFILTVFANSNIFLGQYALHIPAKVVDLTAATWKRDIICFVFTTNFLLLHNIKKFCYTKQSITICQNFSSRVPEVPYLSILSFPSSFLRQITVISRCAFLPKSHTTCNFFLCQRYCTIICLH